MYRATPGPIYYIVGHMCSQQNLKQNQYLKSEQTTACTATLTAHCNFKFSLPSEMSPDDPRDFSLLTVTYQLSLYHMPGPLQNGDHAMHYFYSIADLILYHLTVLLHLEMFIISHTVWYHNQNGSSWPSRKVGMYVSVQLQSSHSEGDCIPWSFRGKCQMVQS